MQRFIGASNGIYKTLQDYFPFPGSVTVSKICTSMDMHNTLRGPTSKYLDLDQSYKTIKDYYGLNRNK